MGEDDSYDPGSIFTIESLVKFPDENPNPILRIGTNGRLLYANDRGAEIVAHWGIDLGEEVPPGVRVALANAIIEGGSLEYEVLAAGRQYSLLLTPIADTDYVNVYGRDVTDQRLAEEWVRDLARFPDEDPNPVLRIDRRGEVIYANGASEQLLRQWQISADNRVPDALSARIVKAIALDEHFVMEVETEDGTLRLEMAPVPAAGYLNVYGRNITRQRAAEAELMAARDQALAASRAKSAFLANMSHELRTPMNAILGYSEMLVEELEGRDDPEMLSDLRKVHGAGRHLLNLINDILDLSKIEAGRMDFHLEDVSVPVLVEQVLDTARPLVRRNDNSLEAIVGRDVGEMYTDVIKLRQSLLNLLSNAAKFTSEGTIVLKVEKDGEFLRFSVIDDGIGLSKEQQDRIFDSFIQADVSTTRRYGGTGLGLTITRHYCEMLGGSVEVRSEAGQGAAFTLVLPERTGEDRASSSRAPSRSIIRSEAAQATGHLVLVIDDDQDVREILKGTLCASGFDVICAESGEEGLRLARELSPVAITLDVVMQGMDGWSILTELKSDPGTKGIPIVLVTISDDKSLGLALGAAEFITKPVDRARLVEVIESYRANDPEPQVLLVEDDESLRSLMSRTLEKQGWSVVTATHGGEALEALEHVIPRVVLLDLMMPVVDGFEFLAKLRTDERYRDLPVIVVTAKELDAHDRERLDGRVAEILEKARHSRAELLTIVRDLVRESAASMRPPAG